jgi:hypothetical protein
MKKIFLICTFFVSFASFSQIKVRPGAKLGMNISNLSNLNTSSSKTGLNASAFVNIGFTRFYELQPEIGYSNQGTTLKTSNFSNEFDPMIDFRDSTFDLEYLTLGITNKFYPIKDLGLNLIVGPSLDLLVGDDYNDEFITVDLSLFGGIGYEFPFGLGLEVRYKQGLIDVRRDYNDYIYDTDDNYYDEPNVLNGVLQLGVSYRFNFSK